MAAYIIIDRVTDQVMSWHDHNGSKWNAAIDNDTDEVKGGAFVIFNKKDAVAMIEALETEFKDEPGGIDFEILKVGTENLERKTRTGYVSHTRVFLI